MVIVLIALLFVLLCNARDWKEFHKNRKTAQKYERLIESCNDARETIQRCAAMNIVGDNNSTELDRRRHVPSQKTQKQINQESFKDCPHTRKEALECSRKYIDANHDGYICKEEADLFKQNSLYWYEELAIFIFQVGDIMSRCDFDDDGLISEDDFKRSEMTCLKDCSAVMDLFNYGCSRAEAKGYVPQPVRCQKTVRSDSDE